MCPIIPAFARRRSARRHLHCLLAVLPLLLACRVATADAAGMYRCVNAGGPVAFQDAPCPAISRQSRVELTPQPLIGAPGERHAYASSGVPDKGPAVRRASAREPRQRHAKALSSWECRAADGEIFYRHARCPGSIAGDGVVRGDGWEARGHGRRRGNAWGRIPVHGTRIPRATACARIQALTADSRDGHQHDANVSVYDHLMGRDPCAG